MRLAERSTLARFAPLLPAAVAAALLEPLWRAADPVVRWPGPLISAPIDGQYYLWNADEYDWAGAVQSSLWFHPLLSLAVRPFGPDLRPYAFWAVSIVSALVAVILLPRLVAAVDSGVDYGPADALLLAPAPGAALLLVGLPEFPLLAVAMVLLLLVERRARPATAGLLGVVAVLIKPTALVLVPGFVVYLVDGLRRSRSINRPALSGLAGIALGQVAWMAYVDTRVGTAGAYLEARRGFQAYIPGSPTELARWAVDAVAGGTSRNRARLALMVIPLAGVVAVAATRPRSTFRNATLASVAAVAAWVVLTGNPNKVVFYLLTIHGVWVTHIQFLHRLSRRRPVRVTPAESLYLVASLTVVALVAFGAPRFWFY